jgi:hypothetical protein
MRWSCFHGISPLAQPSARVVRRRHTLSRSDHRGPGATPQPGARIAADEIEVSDGAEDRLHVRV